MRIDATVILRARVREQQIHVEVGAGRAFREEPVGRRRRDAHALVARVEQASAAGLIHRALDQDRHVRRDLRRDVGGAQRPLILRLIRYAGSGSVSTLIVLRAARRHTVGHVDRRLTLRPQVGDGHVRRVRRMRILEQVVEVECAVRSRLPRDTTASTAPAAAVSAWLPKPLVSHVIVRSTTICASDSATVANEASASPVALPSTFSARRACGGSESSCGTSAWPSTWNRSSTTAVRVPG